MALPPQFTKKKVPAGPGAPDPRLLAQLGAGGFSKEPPSKKAPAKPVAHHKAHRAVAKKK